MEKKNFLDHVNDKKEEVELLESFKGESFQRVKKSYKWLLVPVTIVVCAFMIFFFMMNQKVTVADLTNLTLEEGRFWAGENDLNLSVMEVYTTLESGRIQSQDVTPGSKLPAGSIIKVTVSKGQDPYGLVTLPTFDQSWTQGSIVTWLNQNGIENYSFIEEISPVQEGYLVRYKLMGVEAEDFNRSSEIQFVISQLVDTGSVEVPDFINQSLTDLDMWATAEGLNYHYTYENNTLYDEDRIFYQSLSPEDNMSREDVLIVKVSSGEGFESLTMDNLMNQPLSQGEAWLKNQRMPYKIQYKYSDSYGENIIMDQSVYEGAVPTEPVVLTVSLGQGLVMPDFTDLNIKEAERLLGQYDNMSLVEVYDSRLSGQYILQTVPAGKTIGEEDYVEVWYSLGQTIVMEDFRGESQIAWENWIEHQNQLGAGLTYKITSVVSDDLESGLIVKHDMIHQSVPMNAEIQVQVSAGLTIPDFQTLTLAEAIRFSESSPLDLNIVERYDARTPYGDLISQSVAWGQLGEAQENVEVVYSLGNALIVPDYVDQPISDLESWVIEENRKGAELTLNVYERFDNEIGYGNIITQSAFSRYVPVGTTLEVLISKGESYRVPDFSTYLESTIATLCKSNKVSVVFKKVDSDLASGTVVSQSPEAGTEMSKDEFIIIEISE